MVAMGTALVALVLACLAGVMSARTLPLQPSVTIKSQSASGKTFDFFMFAREWPGGFCSAHSCPRLHTHGFQFTIHGLWPNYNKGGWPEFCNPDLPFKPSTIEDLETVMDGVWPSFTGTNEEFWAHEWDKHGTCAMSVLRKEHSYFKKILKLNQALDLSVAFLAADIQPSSKRTYTRAAVLHAIEAQYGVEAQLQCSPNGDLMEVWMCVDKDLKPFSCARSNDLADDNCAHVRLPPPRGMSASAAWLPVADVDSRVDDDDESVKSVDDDRLSYDEYSYRYSDAVYGTSAEA